MWQQTFGGRMAENRYLSLRQVQFDLGLGPREVEQLLTSGRLPAFCIAGRWRVDRVMLERLVDDLIAESEPILRRGVVFASPNGRREDGARDSGPVPAQRVPPRAERTAADAGLTAQQRRIVQLVSRGMSNAEIAEQLSVEVSTVKSHVSRVLQRLNLRDREQLIAHAWRTGVMERDD